MCSTSGVVLFIGLKKRREQVPCTEMASQKPNVFVSKSQKYTHFSIRKVLKYGAYNPDEMKY